jgi:hypothetical protein
MKISELIKVLEDLKTREGDLNVKNDSYGTIFDPRPEVDYIYHQTDKRSRAPRLWRTYEEEINKGEKVIRI